MNDVFEMRELVTNTEDLVQLLLVLHNKNVGSGVISYKLASCSSVGLEMIFIKTLSKVSFLTLKASIN